MIYESLSDFASKAGKNTSPKGALALVFLDDDVEIESTIAHIRASGFSEVILAGNRDLFPEESDALHCVSHNVHAKEALSTFVNKVIAVLPNRWMHYCYNAEYLFFPFRESRNISELIAFNVEERRDTVLTYVIDLYSNDLGAHPNGVSIEHAHLDRDGYYALARYEDGEPLDRQLDFFGGLRWRYEEHVPWERRKIDRVSLFKAVPGLKLREDHTFNMPEYNTYSCPWHNNITGALCSFRTAKALLTNPGSKKMIGHFWWNNSEKFEWNSRQLLELGIIEPGQWF